MPWLAIMVLLGLGLGGCGGHSPARVETREAPVLRHSGWHLVQPGDTLYSIAMGYGLNYRHLAAWNGIRPPYLIRPGQRLRVFPPAGYPPYASVAEASASKPLAKGGKSAKKVHPAPRTDARSNPGHRPRKAPPAVRRKAARRAWIWPVRGRVVSRFRRQDKTRQGIRIEVPQGTPVKAARGGEVVYSGSALRDYGRLVIVKHGADYLSAYGFNRRLRVKEGQRVTQGEVLAESGKTPDGRPLLYFEIWHDGEPTDPLRHLPRPRSGDDG